MPEETKPLTRLEVIKAKLQPIVKAVNRVSLVVNDALSIQRGVLNFKKRIGLK